jgi:hypothetical protein
MIIGLTGKARSGKSTCANHLVEGHGFVRINFKDALVNEMKENLKDTLEKMCQELGEFKGEPWTIERLFDEKPPIMRALMQNYGTDIRRKDKDSYWTDRWNKAVAEAIEAGDDIVVDDVRFKNEADAVKLQGGNLVRVIRKGSEPTDNPTHISETEMDEIEVTHNISCITGDVVGLQLWMNKIIEEYGKREE